MKFKVGNKLQSVREDRKLTQAEMADLLGISASAYSRLERNEVQANFDFITRTAETLNVPLHEFLPDTLSFFNNHYNGQGGVVFGNFNYYANANESERALREEVNLLKERIKYLNEVIALLKKEK